MLTRSVFHTWLVRIVGIEFGHQPRDDDHLDEECEGVKEWLRIDTGISNSILRLVLPVQQMNLGECNEVMTRSQGRHAQFGRIDTCC